MMMRKRILFSKTEPQNLEIWPPVFNHFTDWRVPNLQAYHSKESQDIITKLWWHALHIKRIKWRINGFRSITYTLISSKFLEYITLFGICWRIIKKAAIKCKNIILQSYINSKILQLLLPASSLCCTLPICVCNGVIILQRVLRSNIMCVGN